MLLGVVGDVQWINQNVQLLLHVESHFFPSPVWLVCLLVCEWLLAPYDILVAGWVACCFLGVVHFVPLFDLKGPSKVEFKLCVWNRHEHRHMQGPLPFGQLHGDFGDSDLAMPHRLLLQ